MTNEIKTQWGLPFSTEQKELANKLIARLNQSQISLLEGYYRGDKHAQQQVQSLVSSALVSSGGSVENLQADPAQWGLTILQTMAQTPAVEYSRTRPFLAPILVKRQLNGEGSVKETWHIELSLEGSGLSYEAGDALGVFGHNPYKLVEGVLQKTRLDPHSFVEIEKGVMSLREALTHHLELSNLSADVLKKYSELAANDELRQLIANREAQKAYVEGRDVLDLISDYPCKLKADDLATILKKMRPRLYSIASSPNMHPNQVHLTVGAVRYQAHGREKEGTVSTYLADRIFDDSKVPVFVHKNNSFRLPADAQTPIILVGAGTGIAPFRAFIEERSAQGSKARSWMFFGNPSSATDFLYADEWQGYQADGSLTRLSAAFSRDQAHKIYVQHRIVEHSAELYAWLQDGAVVYVCGNRDNLGESVRQSFATVLEKEGGLSPEEALQQVNAWRKGHRYHEDIY